ncbi:TPA: hypothetical protein JLK53_003879 [Escherichia coli]|nr:hypothetical protein [Escherichia coli]
MGSGDCNEIKPYKRLKSVVYTIIKLICMKAVSGTCK